MDNETQKNRANTIYSAPSQTPQADWGAITRYTFGQSRSALSALHEQVTDALKADAKAQIKMADLLADKLGGAVTPDAALFLCRQLARIATEDQAKQIAKLLGDPALSDAARYALHAIPGEKVDKALLDKLQKADPKVQVGIINTLGARKSALASGDLKKLSGSKDEKVAEAAKAALAEIA